MRSIPMKTPLSKGSYRTIFILAVLLCLNACGGSGDTAEQHLSNAKTSFQQNKINEAVIELKNALQKDPDLAEARWLLGKAYIGMGNGPAAVKEIERAAALGYSTPESQFALYQGMLLKGDFQEVLDLTEAAAASQPTARLLSLRAEAHLGLKHAEAAKESFTQALENDSESVESHLGLARMSMAYGQLVEAKQHIGRALEIAPDDVRALILKGTLDMTNNESAAAEIAFSKALEGRKNEFNAMLGLARAQLAQGKHDAALDSLAALDKVYPNNPMSRYLRGYITLEKGDQETAKDLLRQVIADVPEHPQSLLLLGNIYYREGKLQQAEEYIKRFMGIYPAHLPTIKLMAAIQISQNHHEDAIKTLTPAIQANSTDAQLLALLGSAYMKTGDTAKGSELLEQASELDPKAASILTQLALSHLVTGATAQAVTELESAVELNPDLVQADILLILSHLRNKNYDAALEAGRNLSKKQPKSPLPFNLIGAAYIGKGDLSGAREYFELALKSHPDFTPAMVNLFNLDIQEGKQESAQNRIEEILKIDPKNAQALIAKARFAAEAGNNAESLQLLESARSENPSAFKPRLLLGRFYTARNEPGNALAIARELQAIAPENPDTQLLLGQALRLNRQYDEALSIFKKLAESYPEVPEVLYQLAYSTTQAGDAAEGRRIFEKILTGQPNHLRAMLALANLDIRDEKFSDAMKHAVNIQTTYPARPEGKIVEADVLLAENKIAEAIATYQEAYQIKPSTGLTIKIAQIQKNNENTEGALATLDSRISEHPEDLGIRLAKATIQQEVGSTEPAMQGYEAVLKIDENNIVALNNLAWMYQQSGNPKAVTLAQKAYNIASDSPAVTDTFGWILVLNNQIEKGLILLQKALKAAPDSPDIRYHLAAALAKSGQQQVAIKELEMALKSKQVFTEKNDAEKLLESLK